MDTSLKKYGHVVFVPAVLLAVFLSKTDTSQKRTSALSFIFLLEELVTL